MCSKIKQILIEEKWNSHYNQWLEKLRKNATIKRYRNTIGVLEDCKILEQHTSEQGEGKLVCSREDQIDVHTPREGVLR